MYEEFASYYDILTSDVDYQARCEYILSIFERFQSNPTLLLDLACGTGGFSNEFAKRGFSVIGVDISPEMLGIASDKSEKLGLDVLYLCQNAAELDLYGTVDGVICCQDSLNHIIDYDELSAVFSRVSLFLETGKLFIFDLNTPYKHEFILGDNTFFLEEDNLCCVWQNTFSKEDMCVNITLDFFKEIDNDIYQRKTDYIIERAYTIDEINTALEKASLKVEAIFAEMTYDKPNRDTQRIFYVTRKV
ncbi:MAG: class I SAM-dependent methyltransferase [Clostridia bacterium]|nr:class I SAM-dependent methyltransferase [Clostridia bacterium]